MTIEEMKRKKAELGYSNEQISRLSGVPLGTVQKIFGGVTAAPRYGTLQKLEQVLVKDSGHREVSYEIPPQDAGTLSLREPAAFYGEQKRLHTIEDYAALPEDRRAELIDGVFYDLDAPGLRHQDVVGELYYLLRRFVKEQGGNCRVYASPCDVQLDMDEYTMVQPDVLVICDRAKLDPKRCFGAPDLVIEVLSPSTKKKDMGLKCHKYMSAGVREYWLVDPGRRLVMVYNFMEGDDMFPRIYGPEEQVPVAIWEGRLVIDLPAFWSEFDFWEKDRN